MDIQEVDLSDVGKRISLKSPRGVFDATIAMVIVAPNARLVLFDKEKEGGVIPEKQGEIIKKWMKYIKEMNDIN